MVLHSKSIKISDRAFSVIRKELSLRMVTDHDRIKLKDVASDLILLGFENKKPEINYQNQTIQYLLTLKDWDTSFDIRTINFIANIVYWDHIKLALSKGYDSDSAEIHVFQFLTSGKNKLNIIAIIENYLNSIV